MSDYVIGADGRKRCSWCGTDPLYRSYHDTEWGKPVLDDHRQFEFLVLESAQAGLSWITILKKREAYRKAYADFDPRIVAEWSNSDVDRMMNNAGIVRNRRKIESSISNARLFLDISRDWGSFANWLLSFYGGRPRRNHYGSMSEMPAATPESRLIAGEMRKMGFRFFGPVIAYAHLQATGIVDDHLTECWVRGASNAVEQSDQPD